eukprot:1153112-Pelagomonas_calceolata.AAC.1
MEVKGGIKRASVYYFPKPVWMNYFGSAYSAIWRYITMQYFARIPLRELNFGIRLGRLVGHRAQCSLAKHESQKAKLLSSGRHLAII